MWFECCDKWFRCRHCHNLYSDCNNCIRSTRVRCINCLHEQELSATCEFCSCVFAEYFCFECRLYRQQSTEGIFHCNDCGICRIGKGLGIDGSHWHCERCVMCLPNSLDRTAHLNKCIAQATYDDCAICCDNLFRSLDPCICGENCGHYLHKTCLTQYLKSGHYLCPLCKKPFINLKNSSISVSALSEN